MENRKIVKVKNILEIVDVKFMQHVQDFIAQTMEVALLSVNENGPLTQPSKFSDLCIKYARGNSLGCKQCIDCYVKWSNVAAEKGKPVIFKCCTGLTDFVVPVMIEGMHMASVFGGQVLTELPSEKHFRQIAKEIGVDEDEYVDEVRKINIISAEKIQAIAEFLYFVTNSVASLAYANLKLSELGIGYKIPRNIAIEEWLFSNCGNIKRPITSREFEVLKLIVLGKNNTEIAKELSISVHTAKAHVSSILEKFFVEDRVQVAVKAVREGLI